MKNFIKINNNILTDNNQFNTFKKIGTEGFTLYCFLLTQQGQKSYCQTTIKMIASFMNRDIKNPKELEYSNSKKCRVSSMKDKKTISKYLRLLNANEMIEVKTDMSVKLNDILTLKTKKPDDKNFTMISEDLFVDYIHKIGHIGWSLLCILTKLHNSDFGNCSSEGFANPTEEYLSSIIKKDLKTIRAYLYLLQDYKLIKIEPQKPIYRGLDKNGVEFYEFLPNTYVVKNRLVDNKYYLEI